MTIGERIRDKRTSQGKTLEDIAKVIGVARQTVLKYENGIISNIPTDRLELIAKALSTTPAYLMGWEDETDDRKAVVLPAPNITDEVVTFRVNADIAAGYDQPAQPLADWEGASIDLPESALHGRPQSDYFMIRICGNSMYPHYHDGDYVLVLKQPTLSRSGEVGVLLNGDEGTIKKIEYVPGEDWLKLIPFNPEYQPRTITGADLEQCRIIGIPKLLIRNL